jgi:hypothetical protein
MRRQDFRAIELQCYFFEERREFDGAWSKKRNCCIRKREEIHYGGHERRSRQLLLLVSIYLGFIQVAGGVSLNEFSSKKSRPTRQPSGFFVLGNKLIFVLGDEIKLRGPER